jgi:hypothetical protein
LSCLASEVSQIIYLGVGKVSCTYLGLNDVKENAKNSDLNNTVKNYKTQNRDLFYSTTNIIEITDLATRLHTNWRVLIKVLNARKYKMVYSIA